STSPCLPSFAVEHRPIPEMIAHRATDDKPARLPTPSLRLTLSLFLPPLHALAVLNQARTRDDPPHALVDLPLLLRRSDVPKERRRVYPRRQAGLVAADHLKALDDRHQHGGQLGYWP